MSVENLILIHIFLCIAALWHAQRATPIHLTAEQDRQRMLDLLHITSLRLRADADPKLPSAANYDESKAGPYSKLPDPLR
jgi:hypothetical protein